jgi:hypothetical protein
MERHHRRAQSPAQPARARQLRQAPGEGGIKTLISVLLGDFPADTVEDELKVVNGNLHDLGLVLDREAIDAAGALRVPNQFVLKISQPS